MQWYFYIGLIAAICIAVYMMPQLIKVIKTKDTTSISLIMLCLAVLGDLCFVLNGIGILADASNAQRISAGIPILLGNLFGLVISAITMFFKIRNMQWAKKFNIKEDQIPNHYKEIKTSLAKARNEKKQKELAQKQEAQATETKKEQTVPTDTGSFVG